MSDTSKPNYQGDDYAELQPRWEKVEACLEGTEAMRETSKNGESPYLPQFPMEDDESYAYRLKTSTFLPAYANALDSIVGAITRRPPTLGQDVSPAIAADWENIDKAGTHWTVFAQRLLRSAPHYGASYVLTDMPKKPDGILDAEQARLLDFRPFSLLYSAKELANKPRYVTINGARVLQLIAFRECYSVPDGFGDEEVERYRVWRVPIEADEFGNFQRTGNAEWEIWEEREVDPANRKRGQKKKELVIVDAGVSPLIDIPVDVLNANPCLDEPEETEGPMLLNLADLNIKHFQITSDHEKILHKCVPILTATKRDQETELGGTAGLDVLIDCQEGGSASYIEPTGSSLSERRDWIASIEKQLMEMGASLFTEGSAKAAMTATEIRERGGAKQSRISQLADAWKDCLEGMLLRFALWKGEETSGSIIPGVKSSDLVVTTADLPTLSAMVEKGQHSLQTLWAIEQKLGVLPDDFDAEDELQQIEDEQKRLKPTPIVQPSDLTKGATI